MKRIGNCIPALSAVVTLFLAAFVSAQPTQPARRVATVPQGFVKVSAGTIHVICAKEDEAWVNKSLAAVKPATRPTMPVDLSEKLKADRDKVIAPIKTDLALADDKAIGAFYDDKIVASLRKLDANQPLFFYMVVTPDKLKDTVRGGWSYPQFYYNRTTDSVTFDPAAPRWTIDAPADDTIQPLLYDSKEPEDKRITALTDRLQAAEAARAAQVSETGYKFVAAMINEMLSEHLIKGLNLTREQQWFGAGVAGLLTAKYTALGTGVERDRVLQVLAGPASTNLTIDLMHPTPTDILRPELVGAYDATLAARSLVVMHRWATRKGEPAVTKVIVAVRQAKPADAAALLKVIQDTAGEDAALVADLRQ